LANFDSIGTGFLTTMEYFLLRVLQFTLLIAFSRSVDVVGSCGYSITDFQYTCSLSSPSFVNENDMMRIDGSHIIFFNDNGVKRLDVKSGTLIPVPPTILCEKFPNIKDMDLTRIQVKTLTDNSFSKCLYLEQLHLHYNNLTEIGANVFKNNVELTDLYLHHNQISSLDVNTFSSLSKLQSFYISSMMLTEVHEDLFKYNMELINLAIDSNQISKLEANTFRALTKLEHLHLYDNKLTEINEDLFRNNVALVNLYLRNNYITKLEGNTFSALTKLQELELGDNKLTEISEDLFKNNVALIKLYVDSNQISKIELNAFSSLSELSYLMLHGNKLTKFNELQGLSSLKDLELSDNQLTQIHPNFLDSLSNEPTNLNLRNNVCISGSFDYTKATIDEVQPHFEECFENYKESVTTSTLRTDESTSEAEATTMTAFTTLQTDESTSEAEATTSKLTTDESSSISEATTMTALTTDEFTSEAAISTTLTTDEPSTTSKAAISLIKCSISICSLSILLYHFFIN